MLLKVKTQHISDGKQTAQNVKTVFMRMCARVLSSLYQAHEFKALQQLAVLVFQPMSLVDDHAAPLDGVELGAAS